MRLKVRFQPGKSSDNLSTETEVVEEGLGEGAAKACARGRGCSSARLLPALQVEVRELRAVSRERSPGRGCSAR